MTDGHYLQVEQLFSSSSKLACSPELSFSYCQPYYIGPLIVWFAPIWVTFDELI